jgi:hypothetical protein
MLILWLKFNAASIAFSRSYHNLFKHIPAEIVPELLKKYFSPGEKLLGCCRVSTERKENGNEK